MIDPAQIGILTGLDLEASLIAAAVPHASLAVAPIVAMSGGDPARARTEATRLIEAGCAMLLSYGFAGALEPRLKPGTIVVPEQYQFFVPGGVVIPPGSSLVSATVSLLSAHDVPWAQLSVYLLSPDNDLAYCGQNTPDSPTWGSLPAGWTTTFTVTGFRIYRLPCSVTGIRAMLHTRNNGLLIPPTPAETIAEATFPVSYQIQR